MMSTHESRGCNNHGSDWKQASQRSGNANVGVQQQRRFGGGKMAVAHVGRSIIGLLIGQEKWHLSCPHIASTTCVA